ncbi:uncharacterized protein [Oscarella lobularis]|uniref:uncharacterized protein isoform X2 n=1 Tax=Oscarella lobularis TaxID=121494 RepID=UPI0033143950
MSSPSSVFSDKPPLDESRQADVQRLPLSSFLINPLRKTAIESPAKPIEEFSSENAFDDVIDNEESLEDEMSFSCGGKRGPSSEEINNQEIDREIEEKEPGFEKGMVSIEIFSSEKEEMEDICMEKSAEKMTSPVEKEEGKKSWGEVPMDEGENVREDFIVPDQNDVSRLAMLGDSRSLSPPHEESFMRPNSDCVNAVCISTSINCDISNDRLPFTSATPIEEEEKEEGERDTLLSPLPPLPPLIKVTRFPKVGTSPSPFHSTPKETEETGDFSNCDVELPPAIFGNDHFKGSSPATTVAPDQLVPNEDAEAAAIDELDSHHQQGFVAANTNETQWKSKNLNPTLTTDVPKPVKCFDFPSLRQQCDGGGGGGGGGVIPRKRARKLRLGLSKKQKCQPLHNH